MGDAFINIVVSQSCRASHS